MFADLAYNSTLSNRSRRGWTALLSLAAQAVAISSLLLLPLFSGQGLPRLQLLAPAVVLSPPSGLPPVEPARANASNMSGHALLTPSRILSLIANLNEAQIPPAPDLPGGFAVPGGTGEPGTRSSILNAIGSPALPPPVAPTAAVTRVSHMMEGNLILRVQPEYPALARQARIQGVVVLRALISREGKIENLQLLSGHPMLAPAAIDAVRQWRYRPYYLNDQAVEVETQVTINFTLSGG